MPEIKSIAINNLKLDLSNFRTVQQEDEIRAVKAMISISPDRFWALMESLIDDGYLPTENILVLKAETDPSDMIVKEGNRRVAALKLIYGHLWSDSITVPDNIKSKINNLSSEWKAANKQVPCTVYESKEISLVDKIITLFASRRSGIKTRTLPPITVCLWAPCPRKWIMRHYRKAILDLLLLERK